MAGDWIPIRNDLHEDPAVLAITQGCHGLVDVDHTCGKLRRLWVWASEQSADGRIRGGKTEWIDALLGIENVSEMLKSVGWLRVTADGLVFPNWNRWLSKSAKRRALTAKRVAMHRERKRNAVPRTEMLPENRTEQYRYRQINIKNQDAFQKAISKAMKFPEHEAAKQGAAIASVFRECSADAEPMGAMQRVIELACEASDAGASGKVRSPVKVWQANVKRFFAERGAK